MTTITQAIRNGVMVKTIQNFFEFVTREGTYQTLSEQDVKNLVRDVDIVMGIGKKKDIDAWCREVDKHYTFVDIKK